VKGKKRGGVPFGKPDAFARNNFTKGEREREDRKKIKLLPTPQEETFSDDKTGGSQRRGKLYVFYWLHRITQPQAKKGNKNPKGQGKKGTRRGRRMPVQTVFKKIQSVVRVPSVPAHRSILNAVKTESKDNSYGSSFAM